MIKIISDSTCDLSQEVLEKYDIDIIPLHIVKGNEELEDGPAIDISALYKWADENKTTPKTSAPSIETAMNIMRPYIEAGREIICFSISGEMSTSGNVIRMAAEELEAEDAVTVIDSRNLSTGIGLLVVEAAIMAADGKSREEIRNRISELIPKVRASFVVDTLVYLYRGGRCSAVSALIGGALALHPMIVVKDGKMDASKKYRGKIGKVIIDYMDNFKVFTWDEEYYDKKGVLCDKMEQLGFKPVTIIDPGTKKEDGYFMYEEGVEKGYFTKDTEGNIYVNEVWPGESVFPDFGRKEVRDWWADHHKELLDMGIRGIWDDMNEPASFRGELPQDVQFHDEERQTTHAEIHNVYGHNMSRATYAGIRKHTGKRPFVITRACYAGSQKYSTVWTGDNQSLWSHLQMMVPQICNLGMSGFTFCGADVGGFGADCTPELLSRWVEAACFSPLFRNHSCQGSKRQEPWQFGDEVVAINRKYIELRYKFLPYIYDLFYKELETGLPVMRPLVLHYADDPEVRNLNGEFLVGEQMLVAPVLEQGATKKMVYLPEGVWYDYWTGEKLEGKQYLLREAPIDVCPIYIKEGSILPMYDVCQYVGEKPYTTLHLLTTPGAATYEHFQDNGTDYAYEEGAYNLYQFTMDKDGNVVTDMLHENYPKYESICVETLGK